MLEKLAPHTKVELMPNPFVVYRKQVTSKEIKQFKDIWGVRSKNILYVGRLAKHKGVEYLINAFRKVRLHYEDLSLLIVGTDDGRSSYRRQLEKVSSMVPAIFTGYLSDTDLAKAYAASDILVLPSSYEAFGMVLLEAMTYGIAVIGTNVGGIPYVLEDGKCGKIVEYGNEEQLCSAIRDLLNEEATRVKLIENGYARINDFSIESISKRLEDLYLSLLC